MTTQEKIKGIKTKEGLKQFVKTSKEDKVVTYTLDEKIDFIFREDGNIFLLSEIKFNESVNHKEKENCLDELKKLFPKHHLEYFKKMGSYFLYPKDIEE